MNEIDAEHHDKGCPERAEQEVEVEHDCEGDAGYHAVNEGITKEGHPSYDHPGSDNGEHNRSELTGNEGTLLYAESEWVNQPIHGDTVARRAFVARECYDSTMSMLLIVTGLLGRS
jgi:hypothetical protein